MEGGNIFILYALPFLIIYVYIIYPYLTQRSHRKPGELWRTHDPDFSSNVPACVLAPDGARPSAGYTVKSVYLRNYLRPLMISNNLILAI